MRAPQESYTAVAPYYDMLLNPVLDTVRRIVSGQLELLQPHSVLDVCCGTARQAVFLPLSAGCYTGVDRCFAMLRQGGKTLAADSDVARTEQRLHTSLIHADGVRLPFGSGTFDVAIIAFALHEKPYDEACAVVHEALRVATKMLVVDYAMPERNLAYPGTWLMHIPERLAGRLHYAYFRQFMRAGGLQGFAHSLHLREIERRSLWGGGAAVALYSL